MDDIGDHQVVGDANLRDFWEFCLESVAIALPAVGNLEPDLDGAIKSPEFAEGPKVFDVDPGVARSVTGVLNCRAKILEPSGVIG